MILSRPFLLRCVPLAAALAVLVAWSARAEWWSYPKVGMVQVANTEGDELAIRVDKSHRLPKDYVPKQLAELSAEVIRTRTKIRVKRELLDPLRHLNKAARRDGIDLSVISGYRSFERQTEVYKSWLRREGGDVDATDKYSARPGHSEHQLGTVVDFSTSEIKDGIGPQFNRTRAATWLAENAGQFGFRLSYPKGRERETGYLHEGWHWRYWGDAQAGKGK